MTNPIDSIRLLEEMHSFPCEFMIKVIGRMEERFVERVVETMRECQRLNEDPIYRLRESAQGRHVAITFEPMVQSAYEVVEIYARMREVRGVVMMM